MIKAILFLFVFLLCVIGLSEIIHAFWIRLIRPKSRSKKILISALSGDFADLQLRCYYEEMLWHGKSYADELICVDLIEDDCVRERCMEFATNKNIRIIKEHQLSKINITEF